MNLRSKILLIIVLLISLAGCLSDGPVPTPDGSQVPTLTAITFPTDTPAPEWWGWWNLGTRDQWPEFIEGYPVGYAQVKEDSVLWVPDDDNILIPFENPDWGNNTSSRRIIPKAGKWIMVWVRGTDYHFKPIRPYSFDGNETAYLVMIEQIIDGKELWALDLPKLYLKTMDVSATWTHP